MRSLLFVPADSDRKLEKSLSSDADVIIVDLEDSVALSAKPEARRIACEFLQNRAATASQSLFYVRINDLNSGHAEADLDAVMPGAPDGIMVPKTASGRDIQKLHAMLDVREAEAGLADGATRIIPVATETAASVFGLGTYAGSSERLAGMTWGAEDLSADLGAAVNRDTDGRFTEPFRLARNLCLCGAVAARVAPIDTVFTAFRDPEGLAEECREAERDGFTAKLAIHPAQVPIINSVFTPSDAAVERAMRIVDAFRTAGDAGVIGLDGEMLDRPHLKRALGTLARAGRSVEDV